MGGIALAYPLRHASMIARQASRRTLGVNTSRTVLSWAGQKGQRATMYAQRSARESILTENLYASGPVYRRQGLSTSAPRAQEQQAEEEREMNSGEQDIYDILQRQFQPKHLQVQDVSGGCGSFYAIIIASSKFKGVSTVKAHRQVNDALKDIIKGIHGLQLRTMAAEE